VRFKLAGARTVAEPLERFEDEDTDDSGKCGRANGGEAVRTAKQKKKDSGGIPDPAVAKAGAVSIQRRIHRGARQRFRRRIRR